MLDNEAVGNVAGATLDHFARVGYGSRQGLETGEDTRSNDSSQSCGSIGNLLGVPPRSLPTLTLDQHVHRPLTALQGLLPLSYPPVNWPALVDNAGGCDFGRKSVGGIVVTRASAAEKSGTPLIDAGYKNIETSDFQLALPPEEVSSDIDAIQEGFHLQRIRRFYGQHHWAPEPADADFGDRAEPGLQLENVAAHSWHVADAAHLLAGHFPELDVGRVVLLAVIHDKLEIYTGDYDPVGPDGAGTGTHAFDEAARQRKQSDERVAAEQYLSKLRPAIREWQRLLLEEAIEGTSAAARFIKAIDKLQALPYPTEKKRGKLDDAHLEFTLMYSRKALVEFPRIRFHYAELLRRFLDSVAEARGVSRDHLDRQVFGQLELKL